jgi:HEAT repeat protein
MESKEKGVRMGSIYLLAKIDDLRVISLLTKATKDADGDVRSAAKLALKKINKK